MFIITKEHEALVIDPHENEEVISLFKKKDINQVTILLSHEHFDHTSGVEWFRKHFACKLICNRQCADRIAISRNNNPMLVALVLSEKDKADGGNRYEEFKQQFKPYTIKSDIVYDTPCEFKILGYTFKATQTPGHSPGSWCLIMEDSIVITGDSLIKDTAVVIRFQESRVNDYRNIALPYLKSLDPELWVLPGHFDPFKLKDNNILHAYNV